jgi:hypothetical protein
MTKKERTFRESAAVVGAGGRQGRQNAGSARFGLFAPHFMEGEEHNVSTAQLVSEKERREPEG